MFPCFQAMLMKYKYNISDANDCSSNNISTTVQSIILLHIINKLPTWCLGYFFQTNKQMFI